MKSERELMELVQALTSELADARDAARATGANPAHDSACVELSIELAKIHTELAWARMTGGR
ncbi:MAG: hypothetical protein JSR41_04030 [Proteobacteria bacterium]|nr:hypothetical protein [Pseudomonadota bacterium]